MKVMTFMCFMGTTIIFSCSPCVVFLLQVSSILYPPHPPLPFPLTRFFIITFLRLVFLAFMLFSFRKRCVNKNVSQDIPIRAYVRKLENITQANRRVTPSSCTWPSRTCRRTRRSSSCRRRLHRVRRERRVRRLHHARCALHHDTAMTVATHRRSPYDGAFASITAGRCTRGVVVSDAPCTAARGAALICLEDWLRS